MCSFMSFELYQQLVLARTQVQTTENRTFVPRRFCVWAEEAISFDVSPALSASCVTYLYLTKDSSQNPKARLVG